MEKQKRKNSDESNKYRRVALIITGLILAVATLGLIYFGVMAFVFCANTLIGAIGLLIAFSAPFGGFASAILVSNRLKSYPGFQHYVEMTVATLMGAIAYGLVSIFIGSMLFMLAPPEFCVAL